MKKNVLCLLFLAATVHFAQDHSLEASPENLKQTVEYLASPELTGRLAGSEGYNIASEFAAGKMKDYGLLPLFDDGYFQRFNLESNKINSASLLITTQAGKVKSYNVGDGFVCRGFTGRGKVEGETVFAGYGISMPESGYDDYSGLDVKGEIVIIFKYNPAWSIEGIKFPPGTPRQKSKTAMTKGALGIIMVSLPNDKNPQKTIGSVMAGEGEQLIDFPQIHADIDLVNDLLEGCGYDLKTLQTIIDSTKKPFPVGLQSRAVINVDSEYFPDALSQNIAGMIRGNDPILQNQYIILGAHLDHVGKQGDIYFPGANDNASGSAALLEAAKILSGNKSLKRSVIFVLFTAEESGLFGSDYFAAHLPVDTSSVVAMINMDCIGHGDSLQIGGGKTSNGLWSVIRKLDSESDNIMVSSTWAGGGADSEPFFRAGLPTAYFVTTKSYTHLHCLTDTPETLNYDLLSRITSLAARTVQHLAAASSLPVLKTGGSR